MTRHIESDHLQDLLEGLLASDTESEIREHLAECDQCRAELEALGQLMADTKGLPTVARPARDLWPQIAWRLERAARQRAPQRDETGEAGLNPAAVPAQAPAGPGGGQETGKTRWVRLPAWQLLAAGIALIMVSGGSVWAFLTLGSDAMIPTREGNAGVGALVSWEEAYEGYDEAVADLEAVLEQGREVLDPETVRVLEENLRAIDTAIRDAEEVLARDPSSGVVRRLLADNLRRKVDLLRQAADAVYSIS